MMRPLLQLTVRYLRPYKATACLLLIAELCSVAALLALPTVNAALINEGVAQTDVAQIMRFGGIMLLISLAQVLAAACSAYWGASVASQLGRDLRADIFRHVGRLSSREIHGLGVPSLITRCTNDVQQIHILVLMTGTMILTAPIMIIGGIAMALSVDAGLAWVLLAAFPLLGLCVTALVLRMLPSSQWLQERIDIVNGVVRDQLLGSRVIRAFAREESEAQRFDRANSDVTLVTRTVGRLTSGLTPTVLIVLNLAIVGILWFGGHRIGSGQLNVGDLAAYLTYATQILASTLMVSVMLVMLPRAAVSAARIEDLLTTQTSTRRPLAAHSVRDVHGSVLFDRACVRHAGAEVDVLDDISLAAGAGTNTLILGSTGAGKTTLISLVARLMDVTDGEVRIDGIDVRQWDPIQLSATVGLVPQKAYLFGGTVRSNLAIGNPKASDDALWESLAVAQARDFVEALDGGLDAPVLPGAKNFSGGQRQRLCLARAFVARPRIYLLDNALSALDPATAARVRRDMARFADGATVLEVCSRPDAVHGRTQIVVLEDGRCVGSGTHAELLDSCVTYQQILRSQEVPVMSS